MYFKVMQGIQDMLVEGDYSVKNSDNEFLVRREYENTEQYEDRITRQYVRFVWYMVTNYIKPIESESDDYFQEGSIGLIKAIRTFDISKGNKFITYASRVITNEMYMYRRNNKDGGITGLTKYKKLQAKMAEIMTENPEYSIKQLIEALDVSPVDLQLTLNSDVVSLAEFVSGTEETLTLEMMLAETERTEAIVEFKEEIATARRIIHQVFSSAKEATREIYRLFMQGEINEEQKLTQKEIAEKVDLSQSYVSRLIKGFKKQISKLKAYEDMENKAYISRNSVEISGEEFLEMMRTGKVKELMEVKK